MLDSLELWRQIRGNKLGIEFVQASPYPIGKSDTVPFDQSPAVQSVTNMQTLRRNCRDSLEAGHVSCLNLGEATKLIFPGCGSPSFGCGQCVPFQFKDTASEGLAAVA